MREGTAYQQACAAIADVTGAWAKGLSLADIRTSFEDFLAEAGGPLPVSVTQTALEINGCKACWFTPPLLLSHRPLLYCHGGGFQIGSIKSHASLMARLAVASGMRVLGYDYRLAPEHRAPAAHDDSFMVYQWLLERGEKPLAFVGDSAGGALALATALKARDAGLLLPQALILLSPWLDLGLSGASYQTLADRDVFSKPEQLRAMARSYAGRDANYSDPALSPVFARLEGLPPILIHAGAHDITLDDAHELNRRAQAHAVPVHLKVFPDMFHHFQVFSSLPETEESLREIGTFLKGLGAVHGPFA